MVMFAEANWFSEEEVPSPLPTTPPAKLPPPLSTKFRNAGGASTSMSWSKYSLSEKVADEEEDEEDELNEDEDNIKLGNDVVLADELDMFVLVLVKLLAAATSRLAAMA